MRELFHKLAASFRLKHKNEEARPRARIQMGGWEQAKEGQRDARGRPAPSRCRRTFFRSSASSRRWEDCSVQMNANGTDRTSCY